MPVKTEPTPSDEINLRGAWRTLRRAVPAILAITALAAGGAYLLTKRQAPEYQASATILSVGSPTTNQNLNQTLVSPPALPQDALRDALSGPAVLTTIRNGLPSLGLNGKALTDLQAQLDRDAAGTPKTFTLKGLPDAFGNAVYNLSVKDARPEIAAGLANLAAASLVSWDTNRGVTMAKASRRAVQGQLTDLSDPTFTRGLDPRAVSDARTRLSGQLSNLTALERAAVGSLSVLRAAVPPAQPVTSSPTKNALLAGAIAAFLAIAASFLIGAGSRSVEGGQDFRALDLRVLAEVPRIDARGKGPLGVLAALTRGNAAEALALARFNALNVLGKDRERVILITSPVAGEGKSSLTASLGAAFAANGQKTLIVDADLRRPAQSALWSRVSSSAEWVALPGAAPFPTEEARDFRAAILRPDAAQARKLRENLHLLPAGPLGGHSTDFLASEGVGAILRSWASGYDVVLLDSPPLATAADAVLLSGAAAGVLLVSEPGRADYRTFQGVLDALSLAGANVLGVVLNKTTARRRAYGSREPAKA